MTVRICLLVALLCTSIIIAPAEESVDRPLSPGTEAPDFTANTLESVPLSLSQWEGRVIALNFFITWYRDAGEHLKMLEELRHRYGKDGIRLLSISLDEGERAPEEVRSLVADRDIAHPVVLDPKQEIARTYGVRALPAIFVIDHTGKVTHYQEGYTEGDERRLSQAIAAALEIEVPEKAEAEDTEEEVPAEPVCGCFGREE